ncbi:hypothetical protein E3N88_01725 [Mikania micrantha]|uniref:Cysteine-rich receptor-like protein kinase 2 n=1 Tax=Mikania micrantha TaxID=192012 RepID=A0A5N6Q1W9_9ASTR|nr:hypothetical protein E3N88_01725 [Mikania micrantha]
MSSGFDLSTLFESKEKKKVSSVLTSKFSAPAIIFRWRMNSRNNLRGRRVLYARSQALGAGDSVFAAAQCRNYLTVDQCVACFDASVSKLVNCTSGNGAYVTFDNCFVRYEDFADFYNDPYVTEDGNNTPRVLCGNQSASRPTVFNQVVDELLLDIKNATPKASNLYFASTRKITGENVTVYATAQCAESINQDVCQNCMNKAYDRLTIDCLPSTEARFFDMGCFARYSNTSFFNDNQTMDFTNVLKGHSSKAAIIAAAIAGVVLIILVLVLWSLYRSWKKSKKTEQDTTNFEGAVHYNYKDLQRATDNFSQENILGKGGFGEVFKGVLDDNNVVAVKKLHVQHGGVKGEFENEVKLISNIHHRNLLRLLGWSIEGSDYLILVLEYMPNGSLDQFLWGSKRGTLNWNQRYEIIFGIARGLAHLHEELHIKILHRDIKSSNILLSDDFKPKIADFGLARFQPEDQSHVSTKFAGTLGYTAPEYARNGVLSEKVDTYSFGIVILEIVSGRRSTEVKSDSQSIDYLLENERKSLGTRQLTRPTFVNNRERRIYIRSSRPKDMQATQQTQSRRETTKEM